MNSRWSGAMPDLWQIAPDSLPVEIHRQAIAAPAIHQRAIVPIFPKVHDFPEHDHMIGGIDDLLLATTERGCRAREDRVPEFILGIVDPQPLLLARRCEAFRQVLLRGAEDVDGERLGPSE